MARSQHRRVSLSLPIARICTGAEEGAELLTRVYLERNQPVSQQLLGRLRRLEVDVCLDKLADRDIRALSAVLPAARLLTRIQMYGRCFQAAAQSPNIATARDDPGGELPPNDPLRMRKTKERPNMWNKTETDVHIDPGTVHLSRRPELISPLLRSLSQHLSLNSSLVDLRLVGLKVSPSGWSTLRSGLRLSVSLEYVSIVYCKVTDSDLELICPALEAIPSLRKLDLSNNSLGNKSGFLIGRIVSLHSQRKDEYLWANTLRCSQWDSDFSDPVLSELALANNHLDDFALYDLCRVLSLDAWLRTIDLRRNSLGLPALKEICSMLRSNHSLFVVDLRETSVDGRREMGEVVQQLRRNLTQSSQFLSRRCMAMYERRIEEIAETCPYSLTSVTYSAPISAKTSPRRSSQITVSPNSTTCCSPPSSLPSRSTKVDLKITSKNPFKSVPRSSHSKNSLSSTDFQTHPSLKPMKPVEKLALLEGLVSELTMLLDSISEDVKPRPKDAVK